MNFRERGVKAEQYFCERAKALFQDITYIDNYYDYDIEGIKVEVKSCALWSKNGRHKKNSADHSYIFGRFNFKNSEHLEKQRKENIWIAFVVRSHDDFMLLGFKKAQDIKIKRYIRMEDVVRSKPLSLEQFKRITDLEKTETKNGEKQA